MRMSHDEEENNFSLSKFESMLKTNKVFFFDSEEFEEIILHYMDTGRMNLAKKALKLGLSLSGELGDKKNTFNKQGSESLDNDWKTMIGMAQFIPPYIDGKPVAIPGAGTSGNITWQKTATFTNGLPSSSSWVSISSPGLVSTFPTGSLITKSAFRAIITVGSCVAVYTNHKIIYVDPTGIAGTASLNSGTDLNVCEGGEKTLKVLGNQGNVNWQSSINAGVTWTDVPNANTSVFTFENILITFF